MSSASKVLKGICCKEGLCFYNVCKDIKGWNGIGGKGCKNPNSCKFKHDIPEEIIEEIKNKVTSLLEKTAICYSVWADLCGSGPVCDGSCGFAHSLEECVDSCKKSGLDPDYTIKKSLDSFLQILADKVLEEEEAEDDEAEDEQGYLPEDDPSVIEKDHQEFVEEEIQQYLEAP
jgi:hypothetical protein